ncbi:MAG: arginine--tRNA ligase, partial [bacterium]
GVVDAVADGFDFAALGVHSMVATAQASLARFGVEFDEWFRESSLYAARESGVARIEEAEQLLRDRGHVFEHEGASWFRSTAFGDDKDRVIRRAEGDPTYLLGDVAYHLDKARRGFHKVVDIWGPDHHGYIQRLKAATIALGQAEDWLSILIVQQVNLLRDGEPVKMSKREGEIVTLDELVEEVGKDASRFFFLMRRAASHLDFDLELAKQETMENPVYYVQYAHARSRSIFRQPMARALLEPEKGPADLSLLGAEEEIAMMRVLIRYPEVVQESARALEPHRLVGFLREVAGSYHRFYTRGKQEAAFRVLGDDDELSRARLFLVGVLADVLREGLGILGIEAVESM